MSFFPSDIKAEAFLNWIPIDEKEIELKGTHRRNAYEDILGISAEEDKVRIELARDGLYDILPEALFHPVDRFEEIPPYDYRERFAQECELQQAEEENARKFFAPYDGFLLSLSCGLDRIKEKSFADGSFLSAILCDSLPEDYRRNRFVMKLMPFIPFCSRIRGDRDLITLMLRKVLKDEKISLRLHLSQEVCRDEVPRYNCSLGDVSAGQSDCYLGNEYAERVTLYEVQYWNDGECSESFLEFVSEMAVLESFINDYFAGIESLIRFRISTATLPTRLSDDTYFNYLDFNANL